LYNRLKKEEGFRVSEKNSSLYFSSLQSLYVFVAIHYILWLCWLC